MHSPKRMTAAEASVLDAQMPSGVTEDMRDIAYGLFEAMAMTDSRVGQDHPSDSWRVVLSNMARVALIQLQHLANTIGGRGIYLARGTAVVLSARDRAICQEFRGNNHEQLAQKYDLTTMRVRQIVGLFQIEQFRTRQRQLPGFSSEDE